MKVNIHNYTRTVIDLINDYGSRAIDQSKIDEARKHFKAAMIALEDSLSGEVDTKDDEEAILENNIFNTKNQTSQTITKELIPVIPHNGPDTSMPVHDIVITTPNENLGESDIFNF